MEQEVLKGLHCRNDPRKDEWIGTQAGKDAECAIRSGCALFVIYDDTKCLAVWKGAGATLDGSLVRRVPFQGIETYTETHFRAGGFESGGVAKATHFCAANHDRMGDRVREHRVATTCRKDVRSQYRPRRIFRTRKGKQIGQVCRGITDLSGSVDVIGHSSSSVDIGPNGSILWLAVTPRA